MLNDLSKIKFFAYCRKSSEDKKKQIASIEDQISVIKKMTQQEKLNVVEFFTEEKTSSRPGREAFNEMMDRIEKGEANGIICWDVDRLHRNPIDEGRLRWDLQRGLIEIVKTPYRQFYPEDAGLLMGVEGGRATDFSIRLSKNTKRGLYGKIRKGIRPGLAPIGYINIGETGNKNIIPDPDRFEIVRKMWDLFLTGSYSVAKIHNIAVNKWGLKTKIHKRTGGEKVSRSKVYNIFNDTFYYGEFLWKDEETGEKVFHKGIHQPMITKQEFERSQILLGKKAKPKPHTREFAFTGLIKCGECGASISAEIKKQVICSKCKHKFSCLHRTDCPKCGLDISKMKNPLILDYTYYHCSKKIGPCSQKSIRLEDLEKQFDQELSKITFDEDYLKIGLDYLQEKQEDENKTDITIKKSIQKSIDDCEERLNRLNKEYTSPLNKDYDIYTPEEFKDNKLKLKGEIANLKEELENADNNHYKSLEVMERIFNFCVFAKEHFKNGSLQDKRIIFSHIGSNLTLIDKKLNVLAIKPYLLIEKELSSQKEVLEGFEPEKSGINKRNSGIFIPEFPIKLRR